jgi:ribonuclease Z
MPRVPILIAAALAPLLGVSCAARTGGERDRARCASDGRTQLQVLGSGGPMHAEGRGGSAYALWLAHRPVVVVDMGADTPAALARAGAPPGSVEVLLISHLHADHVSGLADYLWGEMAAERQATLVVAGPDSDSDAFPALPAFVDRLIGPTGPFPTLSSLQSGKPFALQLTTMPVSRSDPQPVREHKGIRITALAVPHGAAPALAYRLDGATFSVVLAGDQSGLHPRFPAFAAGADVLVVHATVNDRAKAHGLDRRVGIPERLGAIAGASGVKRLVLSHLMGEPGDSEQARRWSLADLDGVLRSVRRQYSGPVTVASDLVCLPL